MYVFKQRCHIATSKELTRRRRGRAWAHAKMAQVRLASSLVGRLAAWLSALGRNIPILKKIRARTETNVVLLGPRPMPQDGTAITPAHDI